MKRTLTALALAGSMALGGCGEVSEQDFMFDSQYEGHYTTIMSIPGERAIVMRLGNEAASGYVKGTDKFNDGSIDLIQATGIPNDHPLRGYMSAEKLERVYTTLLEERNARLQGESALNIQRE